MSSRKGNPADRAPSNPPCATEAQHAGDHRLGERPVCTGGTTEPAGTPRSRASSGADRDAGVLGRGGLPLADIAELFELAPDAIVGVHAGGSIAFANRMAGEMFALPAGGLVGLGVDDLLPQRLRARHAARRAGYEDRPWRREMGSSQDLVAQRSDGTRFDVEVSLAPVSTLSGVVTVAAIRDVTGRREAKRRIERASRLHATLAAANEAVMQAKTPTGLYLCLCEIFVSTGGFVLAWVGLVTAGAIVPAAAAGPAAGCLGRGISLGEDEPIATAVREQRPVVCELAPAPGARASGTERMRAARVRSACALPITRGCEVIGGLSVWSRDPAAFDEQHLALFEQLVTNVAFALEGLDRAAMQSEIARIEQLALSAPDLRTLLDEAVRGAVHTLRADSCQLVEQLADGSTTLWASASWPAAPGSGAPGSPGVTPPRHSARAPSAPPRAPVGARPVDHATRADDGNVTRVPVRATSALRGEIAVVTARQRPFGLEELSFLRSVASTVAAATERSRVEAELSHLALHDPLTGLPNRALLFHRLARATEDAARSGQGLAVLFIDLDRFKLVNDAFGHSCGDRLLVEVADRLRVAVGPDHPVARIGGDEFAVVCEDVTADDVAALAGRIARGLAAPFSLDRGSTVVTASIGITLARRGAHIEELLREADSAMYGAKANGRDRYEFFDEKMRAQALRWLELESDLRRALERDELWAHYQPIYSLSGGITGVEALVRWDHPAHGAIPPGEFIGLAEDTGLIVPLGARILELACAQLRSWRKMAQLRDLRVAVNISGVQLADPRLPSVVAAVLARHELPPVALQVEITETALMLDTAGVRSALQALRDLGVSVAIDDFGTGYSSLLYLRNFPVDTIKIDRSFVQGLLTSTMDLAIIRSVTELAQVLGLATVAEGVEHADQRDALKSLGCDMAQGFFWAPPLCPEDAERVLLDDVWS